MQGKQNTGIYRMIISTGSHINLDVDNEIIVEQIAVVFKQQLHLYLTNSNDIQIDLLMEHVNTHVTSWIWDFIKSNTVKTLDRRFLRRLWLYLSDRVKKWQNENMMQCEVNQ